MPSLSPSKLCRSSPIILKFLAEMSLQFNTGGGGGMHISGYKGLSLRLAMADRHKDNSLAYYLGQPLIHNYSFGTWARFLLIQEYQKELFGRVLDLKDLHM